MDIKITLTEDQELLFKSMAHMTVDEDAESINYCLCVVLTGVKGSRHYDMKFAEQVIPDEAVTPSFDFKDTIWKF